MRKLYLDDVRPTPKGWERVHSAQECIDVLIMQEHDYVSLDHDLGEGQPTGYDVLAWLEQVVAQDKNFKVPTIFIHTDNPVGRQRMVQALQSIWRWKNDENTDNVRSAQ